MTNYGKELSLAINLVKNAVKITEWFRNTGFKSFLKADKSPVTLADFASQIFIVSELKHHFPNDQIIAEEEDKDFIGKSAEKILTHCYNELKIGRLDNVKNYLDYKSKKSERQWTVDPIDGTIGFQKGLLYSIGIGLMVNSIPKVGVIAVPNYSNKSFMIYTAEEGQGTHILYDNNDFISIKVSQKNKFSDFRLCHSLHYDQPWIPEFGKKIGIKNFIQVDSMVKFAMIAEGTADLYIKSLDLKHSFTWDFLPGDLIVREAGGKVTDLDGKPIRYKDENCIATKPGIISSNGQCHRVILRRIKENFPELVR
jgi:3'(2'), 5'-bisphosphate nucleotidase